jgi:AcrR family transcriptional regulator
MPGGRRANRGRGAAAENRAALIAAAREVFAEQGLDAPLYAVAAAAGVGQGSLYRHFPDRVSLALAVFDESVAELERLAAEPGTTLDDILAAITRGAEDSTTFLDIVAAARAEDRLQVFDERMRALLAEPLAAARREGTVASDITPDDVLLASLMLAGAMARLPRERRREAADDAWRVIRRGWAVEPQ